MAAIKKYNSSKNPSRRRNRVFIVTVALLVLLIPLCIWFVSSHDKKETTISGAAYQGSSYVLYYPRDWTIQTSDLSDIKGTELFMQPPDAAPPKTPHIIIESAPATPKAVKALTDSFTIFKYAKTDVVVNGIKAEKYTNVVFAAEGVLHSTAYVFEAKGNIYLMSLGYKQEEVDEHLESQFSQVVTNFMPQ